MKKTFTANISGTVFHIEEDAYDQLHRYLANIRAKFTGSTGSDEILADIESRICELFTERLQGRQVVTIADVAHVQQVMGRPEDFVSEDGDGHAAGATGQAWTSGSSSGPKRLFRDPDDHWVAGVMGGIGAYFNMDPLWLRVAFIVFVVLGWGSPLLIYFILWVVVPKAETPADRLRMRGEPVTVDNLKRAFDEGAERFKAGAQRVATEAEELGRRWESGGPRYDQARDRAGRVVRGAASVLGRVIGACFLLAGAILAFALLMGNFGRTSLVWDDRLTPRSDMGWGQLSEAWFISPEMATWAWIGVVVLLIVPIIGLIAAGTRLLFDVAIPRWFGWVLTPLWVGSMFLLMMIGIRHANEFRRDEKAAEVITLPMPNDGTVRVAAAADPLFGDDRERYSSSWELIDVDGGQVTWGSTELDVKESPDSLFHLRIVREAHGPALKVALDRARSIHFEHHYSDGVLTLSPNYTTEVSDKLRGQSVSCILLVPVGRSVRFERGTARIIHDIDNTTNTWDPDMVGRTWTMTSRGLTAGTAQDTLPPPAQQREERIEETTTERKVIVEERIPGPAPADTGLLQALHSLLRV